MTATDAERWIRFLGFAIEMQPTTTDDTAYLVTLADEFFEAFLERCKAGDSEARRKYGPGADGE